MPVFSFKDVVKKGGSAVGGMGRTPRVTRLAFMGVDWQGTAAEGTGCAFIAMTVCLLIMQENHTNIAKPTPFVPFGIFAVFAVFITMFGGISGGHFNPAVSTAIVISGNNKLTCNNYVVYVFVQFAFGFFGALLAYWLSGGYTGDPMIPFSEDKILESVALESVYSAILCYMVASVQLAAAGGPVGGLFVALAILAALLTIGPLEGCCINPMLGLAVYAARGIDKGGSSIDARFFFLYLLSPFIGSLVASICFQITHYHLYDHSKGWRSFIPPFEITSKPAEYSAWKQQDVAVIVRKSTATSELNGGKSEILDAQGALA